MTFCLRLLFLCGWLLLSQSAWADDAVQFNQAERHISVASVDEWLTPDKLLRSVPTDGWQTVSLPDVPMQRTVQFASERMQTTLYRMHLSAEQSATPEELFLYLPRWQTVGKVAVYGDGRLLWRSVGDPTWNGFNQPVWVSLEPPAATRPSEIIVRVDSLVGLGAGISTVWVGTDSALAWRYHARMAFQVYSVLIAGIAFLALGLFCLAVWFRRRQEQLYLLCGLASIFFVLRYLHYVAPLQTTLISSAWFGWISVNAINWMATIIIVFNLRLCERRYPKWEFALIASVVLHSLITLPFWESAAGIVALSRYVYYTVMLLTLPICILTLHAAWQQRRGAALTMVLIALIGYPLGFHDLLLHGYLISVEHVYLLPLAQIGFFLMFAYIMLGRYLSGIESLEKSHEVLTMRLQQREDELTHSYARLREVEQRELLSRERQRMMQDMHDGLGGSLVGIMHMIDRGAPPHDQIKMALQESIDELRLTIDSLQATESDIGVLLGALRPRLQSRLETAGLQLHWQVESLPSLTWLEPADAMHVMRIVQEVITNIIKHANAQNIWISTHADDQDIFLFIDDDGAGFAGTSEHTSGHGLSNIRHRARCLRGKTIWKKRLPKGTHFLLLLSLQKEEFVSS